MDDVKLFIATPMYGGVCHGNYTLSLIKLLDHLKSCGIKTQFNFLYNESLITRARNVLAHEFLAGDYTHLLFLDADVAIKPEDVVSLLTADKDIICGIYPKKTIDWNRVYSAIQQGCPPEFINMEASEYAFNVFDGENPRINNPLEPMRVKDAATGYMIIKRNVFDKLALTTEMYIDKSVFSGEKLYNFFQTVVSEDNLLSEDYFFCKTWREAGGEVYIAPWAKAKHIGMYTFG